MVIGPYAGKPIVLDDASYFLAFQSEEEARCVHSLLTSDTAQEFYSAFIFWGAKRPITVDVLQQLDLVRLAEEKGVAHKLKANHAPKPHCKQRGLFEHGKD